MTFFQTFKNAILHPSKLNQSKQLSFIKTVMYVLLLTLFTAIPVTLYSSHTLDEAKQEATNFFKQCPNFKINDGQLKTESKEGIIYKGGQLVLSFDPENKQSAKQLQETLNQQQFGLSFTKNNLIFAVPSGHLAEQMIASNPLTISYQTEGINQLSKQMIIEVLSSPVLRTIFYIFFLLFAFLPSLMSLLSNVLMTALIALLYCKMIRLPLRFKEVFKLTIFSTTLPALIGIVVQLLFNNLMIVNYVYALNLLIFFLAIKNERPNE